jgi:hypothetical protein
MRCMFAFGLALMLPGLAVAEDIEETLRYYLAKSDVVVVGEFASEPVEIMANEELRHSQADRTITQIIKWDAPEKTRVGDTLNVHVLLDAEERLPELKKGGKCMLFLKCRDLKPKPTYITADIWFGVQRPSARLAKALAGVVAEQNKRPLRVPAGEAIDRFYPDPVRGGGSFKDFKIDRQDLVPILRDYHVIPKQDWKHNYSHAGGGDRTGAIVLRDGTKIQYMVRPGGLASLTFLDGRKLFLAATK